MTSDKDDALALALAVRDLAVVLERYRTDIARRYSVKPNEIAALGYLFIDGPVTVSELASELGITSASATEMVDRLDNAGFAQRQPHPTDRRKRLVGLTPDGVQAADAYYHDLGTQLHAMYSTLTPSQRDGVGEFLRRVVADLADASNPVTPPDRIAAAEPTNVIDGFGRTSPIRSSTTDQSSIGIG